MLTKAPSQPIRRDFILVVSMWVVLGKAANADWLGRRPEERSNFVANLVKATRYYPQASSVTFISDGALKLLAAGTFLSESGQTAVHLYD
jgi:hypothetical protein